MSTFIHGIAASENIDSSGERISIAGMDISSLAVDGVYNWEHKADQPGQIVGKVLKAKKIFSEADCEDEHQLYFWNKCKTPYLYVMGELMDDYKESAKEVAGMFRYDLDHKEQNDRTVMNFSIEGAKIEKNGMDILKSIARKVTLTAMPCNKAAIAEMVPAEKRKKKGDIDELFKTEEVQAEIFSGSVASTIKKDEGFSMGTLSASEKTGGIAPNLAVAKPAAPAAPSIKATAAPGPIGHTSSGKPVLGHTAINNYSKEFSEQDHKDAYKIHMGEADKAFEAKDYKANSMHRNRANLHHGAFNTMASKVGGSLYKPPMPKMAMAPMGKSEMISSGLQTDEEASALLNRTEDKYFISKTALDYITQKIKENLKEGDIDTEVRYNTNRSIYLDNKDLDSLKDTLNSVKPRIKIRVRQYSPNSKDWEQVAYVEIKAKEEDGGSNKMRVRIHAKDIDAFCSGEPIQCTEDLANINKDITKIMLEKRVSHINHLVALYGFRRQIEVRYERRAYTNKDIRITIDDNLRFVRSNLISDENILAVKCTSGWVNILQLDHQLKNEGYMVMEVKHQGKVPGWVKDLIKNANAKEVKFSKYCAATTCVIETKQISGFVSAATLLREGPEMTKALDAGSGMAAPSALVGGAALAKESLVGKKKEKSKWLARAEEEYNKWQKREAFESFMAKRLPHLTKGEIKAIGQVMALNKSMNLEKSLTDLLVTFGKQTK